MRSGRAHGVFLLTTLFLVALLLLLSLAFTGLALRDLEQARQQHARLLARHLARAGITAAMAEGLPAFDRGSQRRALDLSTSETSEHRYLVRLASHGDIVYSTGIVEDTRGRTLATHELAVSRWDPSLVYDPVPPRSGDRSE